MTISAWIPNLQCPMVTTDPAQGHMPPTQPPTTFGKEHPNPRKQGEVAV